MDEPPEMGQPRLLQSMRNHISDAVWSLGYNMRRIASIVQAQPVLAPSDVVVLGRRYNQTDEVRTSASSDCASRIWCTYRKDFPSLGPDCLTSDVGWGCTVRSGQMMMAEALLRHHLGRAWRHSKAVSHTGSSIPFLGGNQGAQQQQQHALSQEDVALQEVLSVVSDHPGAYLSIHRICAAGKSHGIVPGRWLGPWMLCKSLEALVNSCSHDLGLTCHVLCDPGGGAPTWVTQHMVELLQQAQQDNKERNHSDTDLGRASTSVDTNKHDMPGATSQDAMTSMAQEQADVLGESGLQQGVGGILSNTTTAGGQEHAGDSDALPAASIPAHNPSGADISTGTAQASQGSFIAVPGGAAMKDILNDNQPVISAFPEQDSQNTALQEKLDRPAQSTAQHAGSDATYTAQQPTEAEDTTTAPTDLHAENVQEGQGSSQHHGDNQEYQQTNITENVQGAGDYAAVKSTSCADVDTPETSNILSPRQGPIAGASGSFDKDAVHVHYTSPQVVVQTEGEPLVGSAANVTTDPQEVWTAVKQETTQDSHDDSQIENITQGKKHVPQPALVLLLPLTLGVGKANPAYFPQLLKALEFPQSIGIVGGRPSASLYFIGYQDDNLIFLDPHTAQKAGLGPASYFCDTVRLMPINSIDPSLALGFMCTSIDEVHDLASRLSCLAQEHSKAPLVTVVRDAADVNNNRTGMGGDGDGSGSGGVSSRDTSTQLLGSPTKQGGESQGQNRSEDDWEFL